MFHLINAEPTIVSSSENSKETVMPSSSSADKSPSVGPLPAEAWVTTSLPLSSPVVVSPSASCVNPVRITSPVKMPVSVPVSTSL
jgi:hypothetical protein